STISGNTASGAGSGIYNDGTLAVRGLVTIDGDYTQTATGRLTLGSGNTLVLAGTGAIDGNFTNAGNLALGDATGPGGPTIDGDYTQTATGTLAVAIGGPQAGTDYSQLVVNGLATLDGRLAVNLVNGYQPRFGDLFQVLTFSRGAGTFAYFPNDGAPFGPLY